MPRNLTPRQRDVLNLIQAGHCTATAIADQLGCRQQAAGQLLLTLYRSGILTRQPVRDGTLGRPSHHYTRADTPTPAPPPVDPARRRLLNKVKAACLEHPELAFFMANPDAPVADPTYSFSNTDKRGTSTRFVEDWATP